MIRKSLIALSAAALGLGMAGTASTAQAKTHFDVDVNLGFGGYGGWDPGYYGGCGYDWVAYKKWNPWHTAYKIKYHKVPVCY